MSDIKLGIWHYIFLASVILTIFLLAWRIFGNSPTAESLLVALISSELAGWKVLLDHERKMSRQEKELHEIKSDNKYIREKIDKLDKLETQLTEINSKLK